MKQYACHVNALINAAPVSLPIPVNGQLVLLITPAQPGSMVFDLSARLALHGTLRVLDAGNTFNVYEVARVLRRSTSAWQERLRGIQMARAFTCYQVAAMLAETPVHAAHLSAEPNATLVLDFLATFQDQNVPLRDRWRLIKSCVKDLRRLSRVEAVAVWVRQRPALPSEISGFVAYLQRVCDRVWVAGEPPLISLQPGLF